MYAIPFHLKNLNFWKLNVYNALNRNLGFIAKNGIRIAFPSGFEVSKIQNH